MITKSAAQTQKVGEEISQKIKNGGVVCLYGDLGAGKTTLVQGIARGLGIKKRVNSPTFVLMRQYAIKKDHPFLSRQNMLYHIDLYRLDNAKTLGLEELWGDPKNILVIEWPEKIEKFLPKNHWKIKLKTLSDGSHEIIY